jgi:hypothetical protein
MTTGNPRLLVLGFYDGPTEGFASGINGDLPYFFKVAAWDEGQNRRLYLLGQIPKPIYQELLAILTSVEQTSSDCIWTPSWKFDNVELEARVNSIVEIGRKSLDVPAALALGESLLDVFEDVIPTGAQLASAKILAQADWPGNLDDWLALGA